MKPRPSIVAEIRLRQLNREYILKRTDEIGELEKDIAEMEAILQIRREDPFGNHHRRAATALAKSTVSPAKQHSHHPRAMSRRRPSEDEIPDYPVNLFFTREGYFKKITPQSPAHERRTEAQGGGRHRPVRWNATNNARAAVLHR